MSLMSLPQLVIAFALGCPLGAFIVTLAGAHYLDAIPSAEAMAGSALAVSLVICGVLMIKNVRPLISRSRVNEEMPGPEAR